MTLNASEILPYDDVNKVINVVMLFVESTATGKVADMLTMQFKQVGASWLLYSDQQLAETGFQVESHIDHDNSNPTGLATKQVSVDVRCPWAD